MNPTLPITQSPVRELRFYLAGFAVRCRSARWFGALFHVGVCENIVVDVAANEARAARIAQEAEQADRAAEDDLQKAKAELLAALRDGIDASDTGRIRAAVGAVRCAARHVHTSAQHDHEAAKALV